MIVDESFTISSVLEAVTVYLFKESIKLWYDTIFLFYDKNKLEDHTIGFYKE